MVEIYQFGPGKKKLTPREVRELQRQSLPTTAPTTISVTDLDVFRFVQNPDERIAFSGLDERGRISKLLQFVTRVRWHLAQEKRDVEAESYDTHRARFQQIYVDSLLAMAGTAPGSPQWASMDYMSFEEKKAWVDELEYRLKCWEKYQKRKKKKPKK